MFESAVSIAGWVGSVCFALCGLPQAMKSVKDKHSDGLANGLLWLWFVGEVLTLVYVLPQKDWPLVFNYVVNLACLLVIIRYKLWPIRTPEPKPLANVLASLWNKPK